MANVDLTNITPPRVPLIDPRTGLIAREWYRFFLNLFQLTGSGQNTTSLTDLQVGPPVPQQEDLTDIIIDIEGLLGQPASGTSELQAALDVVRQELQTLPRRESLQPSIDSLRQELQTQPRQELGTFAALQQDNLPWTTFDTTPEALPTTVGTVAWDGGTTLGIQMTANVLQRVGESEFVYVKASSAITKGQLCYHTGAVGGSGVITAAPTPLALTDPNQIVGVAAETIALNGFGLIQASGDLRGFDTTGSSVGETWADGDPLYYNPAFVGSMTKVKPSAPNQKTYIGEIINAGSGGSGSMNIRIAPGSVLGGTDSNVQISSVANGNILTYDGTATYWRNTALTAGSGISVAAAANGVITVTNTSPSSGGTVTSVAALTLGTTGTDLSSTVANSTTTPVITLNVPTASATNRGALSAADWTTFNNKQPAGTYVTSISIASSNGFAGTSSGGATPAITISTSISGLLYGNGTALAAATVSSPLSYSAGTLSIPVATSSANGYLSSTDWTTFNAKQPVAAPVTKTANFSVGASEVWLINNKSGSSCTVTLPTASSNTGRVLYFLNYQAQTLVSASSNVVPLAGGSAGTAILEAVAGANATLVSDGTNWIMTQYDSNNALQLE